MRLLPLLLTLLLVNPLHGRPVLDKPNIVVVFLDDCGYGFLSHTGNPTIHTPNVSRLVQEGANFPQFYSASPACSASRYSLMTGRNPRRSGLGAWVLDPASAKYIHPNEVTLAEGLKDRGYATGFFGKWHLGSPNSNNGNTPNAFPLAHGFDSCVFTNVSHDYSNAMLVGSNPAGTQPIAGYEILASNLLTNVAAYEDLTRRYRDLSVDFIKANKNNPFLLYCAPNMPHLPIHAGSAFHGKSLAGVLGDCMEEIDAMVGTIVSTLETEGIAQNTLVIFSSDNGQWILYENNANSSYGDTRLHVGSAQPFRDGKGSTWEGGVRVPGVWYWPGVIAPRTVVKTPASTMDVLPTAFALAGEALPSGRTIDGRDIRPFLSSNTFSGTVPTFQHVYTGASSNGIYAARKGPWKLHIALYSQTGNNYGFTASQGTPLLFNVEQDPHERFDRRAQEPAVVAELQGLINDFNNSVNTEQTFWGAP